MEIDFSVNHSSQILTFAVVFNFNYPVGSVTRRLHKSQVIDVCSVTYKRLYPVVET